MTDTELQMLGLVPGGLFAKRYEVRRKLGAGGMALVFEVLDRSLNNEKVALKVFSPQNNEDGMNLRRRFQNEAVITRKLSHPNIVRTYDFGEVNDAALYMTMEFVDGLSLEQLLKSLNGKALDPRKALSILLKIAEAISYAHSEGVIHRDLKPGNVMINRQGEVKVTDFGLAQSLHVQERLTVMGECVGTPAYMAPEVIQGGTANYASDIFAFGVMAFELVTGGLPFRQGKGGWFELANQILNEPLPKFATKVKGLPGWYEDMVIRATEKDPKNRHASAKDLVRQLKSGGQSRSGLRRASKRNPHAPRPKRRRVERPSLPASGTLPAIFTVPLRTMLPPIAGLIFLVAILGFQDYIRTARQREVEMEARNRKIKAWAASRGKTLEEAEDLFYSPPQQTFLERFWNETLDVVEDIGLVKPRDHWDPPRQRTPGSLPPAKRPNSP